MAGQLIFEFSPLIYTREREEELIRATWLDGLYKNIWIEQFKKMSTLIYRRAETVVSLRAPASGPAPRTPPRRRRLPSENPSATASN